MDEYEDSLDPDWDSPLNIRITPRSIIDSVFRSAEAVHTGHESCIDNDLVQDDLYAHEADGKNYCRHAVQEYSEGESTADSAWRDWTVELKIEEVFISAHWRAVAEGSPSDWEWCAREAENAFIAASILVGCRVRRGLAVEGGNYDNRGSRIHH